MNLKTFGLHGLRVARTFLQSSRAISLPLVFLAAALSTHAQAPGDLRVALVIGNAGYPGKAALANPVNDAKAMGDVLRGLGFTVVEVRDGSKLQMADAVSRVREILKGKQAIGLLYYAGHGLQLDWRNYMVPVDAKIANVNDVTGQTIDVSQVTDVFKAAGNRMNIVILDACRDNPFPGSAAGKGLAQIDAPSGTFLAYATAPGNVAEDSGTQSENGLYTQFLLQELKKPASKIEDVFKRTRLNVRTASLGRQIPWESTSLEEDFYFRKPNAAMLSAELTESQFQRQLARWTAIQESNDTNLLLAFLIEYPSGSFTELAQFRYDRLYKEQLSPADKLALGSIFANQRAAVRPSPKGSDSDMLAMERKFKVGMKATYDQNRWSTKKNELLNYKVTKVNESTVDLNDGKVVWDLMGNVLTNRNGRFEFPRQFYPAEFQVGKRWNTRVTRERPDGVVQTFDINLRVVGRESIEVPAGKFDTYVIKAEGQSTSEKKEYRQLAWKIWVAPGIPFDIARDQTVHDNGKLVDQWVTKLTGFENK